MEEEFKLILLNVEFARMDFDVGDSYDYNYVLFVLRQSKFRNYHKLKSIKLYNQFI